MPKLFDRVARITVAAGVGALRHGIRVEKHRCVFKVSKDLKPKPNTAELQIYGLSRDQRNAIEEIRPKKTDTRGIPVLIEAGYRETDASQIFLGDMRTVYSTREGAEWITTLECGDGEKAKQTSRISVTVGPKSSPDTALRAIVKALGIGQGNVSAAVSALKRKGVAKLFTQGQVLSGSASTVMTNFCRSADLEWSIQDGAIQIIDRAKTLSGTAIRLSSTTGLVESPTVDHNGVMTCKMLIIPDVRPGRLIVLDSLTTKGNYRIEKAEWSGDTEGGDWNITAECKRY